MRTVVVRGERCEADGESHEGDKARRHNRWSPTLSSDGWWYLEWLPSSIEVDGMQRQRNNKKNVVVGARCFCRDALFSASVQAMLAPSARVGSQEHKESTRALGTGPECTIR